MAILHQEDVAAEVRNNLRVSWSTKQATKRETRTA